jgi:hypothetical protein
MTNRILATLAGLVLALGVAFSAPAEAHHHHRGGCLGFWIDGRHCVGLGEHGHHGGHYFVPQWYRHGMPVYYRGHVYHQPQVREIWWLGERRRVFVPPPVYVAPPRAVTYYPASPPPPPQPSCTWYTNQGTGEQICR